MPGCEGEQVLGGTGLYLEQVKVGMEHELWDVLELSACK
jgi:hypothetical protein